MNVPNRVRKLHHAIERANEEATHETSLPDQFTRGFDGEAWIWTWRERGVRPRRNAGTGSQEYDCEVSIRLLTDLVGEGFSLEFLCAATDPDDSDTSWSQVNHSEHLQSGPMGDVQSLIETELVDAWRSVLEVLPRLHEIREARRSALEWFRQGGEASEHTMFRGFR